MTRPYRFPTGPLVIQFSGGRTSGYMLKHLLDAHNGQLPAECHVLFQNTSREMPEALDVVQECSSRWGVPVFWIEYRDDELGYDVVNHNSASRNGEPFPALIRKKKYLPNQQSRFSTQELKVRPAKRWLIDRGSCHWRAAIEIRADERHLVKPSRDETHKCFYPLVEARVTRRTVAAFWRDQPFDLCLPNINGKSPLGNCDGCFPGSERTRAFLARYYLSRASWWRTEEDWVAAESNGGYARFDRRVSWGELLEHAERVFDEGAGVYCDTGFGGCHD